MSLVHVTAVLLLLRNMYLVLVEAGVCLSPSAKDLAVINDGIRM